MLTDLFFTLSGMTFAIADRKKFMDGQLSFHGFMTNRIKRLFLMMIISTVAMTMMEYAYYKYGEWVALRGKYMEHIYINHRNVHGMV